MDEIAGLISILDMAAIERDRCLQAEIILKGPEGQALVVAAHRMKTFPGTE